MLEFLITSPLESLCKKGAPEYLNKLPTLLGGSLDLVSLLSDRGHRAYNKGLLGIVGRLPKSTDHPSRAIQRSKSDQEIFSSSN